MSPPQVSLSIKDEIDTDTRIEDPKKRTNKKYKIIAVSAIVTVLLLVGGALGAIALHHKLWRREHFETTARIDDRIFKENIKVDYNEKIIFVSNPAEGEINGLDALHDYDRKILAFKDTTVNRCFIDRLDETFEEGLDKWEKFSTYERVPPKRSMVFIQEPIDSDVLKTFVGERVHKHCHGLESHWIVEPEQADLDLYPLKYKDHSVRFICLPDSTIWCIKPPCRFPPRNPRPLEDILA